MADSLAYFITWNTYGTWLPGDSRGWVEYHHGWRLPECALELECKSRMTEDAVKLNLAQREAVEAQIHETCHYRHWHLHAVNCRSNHIHVVVTALETKPKKVRIDLKSYATRCLKKQFDGERENWWAERGSIRHIYNDHTLDSAVAYTRDAQDRKHREL